MTNRQPWLKGYFETLLRRPLKPEEVWPEMCFWNEDQSKYYDADDEELPGPGYPIGEHAMDSYRTIDDTVSMALGIPLAPDE